MSFQDVPILATAQELTSLYQVPEHTIRQHKPAGTYTPESGRAVLLYATDEFNL